MTIRKELLDELLAGQDPSTVMRQDGLLGDLKKALLNRMTAAEFDHHLDEDLGFRIRHGRWHHRHGASKGERCKRRN